MLVKLYNNSYKEQVTELLLLYFKELHSNELVGGIEEASSMLDTLLTTNYHIYIVKDEDVVVGFMVIHFDTHYGMLKPYFMCDYMYIRDDYRSSKAILYLFTMIGYIMHSTGYDCISTTFDVSANIGNIDIIGGERYGQYFRMSLSNTKTKQKFKKYMRRLYEIEIDS